ncbi:MAG: CAP domain-containing protein [Pseudomonadota bacterium]
MLQKYDTLKSGLALALAATSSLAFAHAATAQNGVHCTANNGYASDLSSYVQEIESCLSAAPVTEREIEEELLSRMNALRTQEGLGPLILRDSLTEAARAHALDMAAREFAAHTDPEGRDHLFRIRALDRQTLIGASGAAVLKASAGNDGGDLFVLLQEDEQNNANMLNASFTDLGFGIVRDDKGLSVTILFADVRGELKKPLPLTFAGYASVQTALFDERSRSRAWGLTNQATGELLAKGKGRRIGADRLVSADTAALNILVENGSSTYSLKGPLVSARQ